MAYNVWFTVIFILALPKLLEAEVRCSGGRVTVGETANISCSFGDTNVKKEKHNFNIVHYSNLATDSGTFVSVDGDGDGVKAGGLWWLWVGGGMLVGCVCVLCH
jgi:hypothetical protein